MQTQPLSTKEILTEINSQWTAGNVDSTTPIFIEATGTGTDSTADALRFDLNRGDIMVSRPGSPSFEEEPIGNWLYGNRTYNITMEIYTRKDRQQLYNLMREVRRICHARKHSLTNFQRLQFMAFTEETTEQVNLWFGTANLQVVNQMVLLET